MTSNSKAARKAMFNATAPTSGMRATTIVIDQFGKSHKTHDYGGVKKAGSHPSATGFYMGFERNRIAERALQKNFFFKFNTNARPFPFGNYGS